MKWNEMQLGNDVVMILGDFIWENFLFSLIFLNFKINKLNIIEESRSNEKLFKKTSYNFKLESIWQNLNHPKIHHTYTYKIETEKQQLYAKPPKINTC